MSNEEKLKFLLKVALSNGFDLRQNCDYIINNKFSNTDLLSHDITFSDRNMTFYIGTNETCIAKIICNNLVTGWEEDEISFIEALYKKQAIKFVSLSSFTEHINKSDTVIKYNTLKFIQNWVLQPTSQRLQFLLNTFNHLL